MGKYALSIFVAGLAVLLPAAELRPLPWSEATNRAARFKANTSGHMTITDDSAEKAVRFDVKFTPGTDFWAYPFLHLEDSLADVEQIRFEYKAQPGHPERKIRNAYVMFGSEQPYYAIPLPKSDRYTQIVIDVPESVRNPAGVRDIRIGMNPRDPELTFFIRNLEFLTSKEISRTFDTADAVAVQAPAAAFVQGEKLAFRLKPYAAVAADWKLRNWKRELLREGSWPENGRGTLTLPQLPNGYYTLEVSSDKASFAGSRSFAVVSDPAKRPANPEMFFAIDSGQSWLARPDAANFRQPPNAYEVAAEAARRLGVQMVRERMSWGDVESTPGKFDWRQYKYNADLLAARGLGVSGIYHSAPGWSKSHTTHLPGDLAATWRFAKTAAETFRGAMKNWEFWNEQDIGFAPEPAWDYASALKAAFLGCKAADPELSVAIGGYAYLPTAYADTVMKNGAGDYFDIFNIHTYSPIREYPAMLEKIREHMAKNHIADRPVWFTESGCRLEGSGRLDSYMKGLKMHDPDQELLIAEFIPKMMISMQMLGVSRDFFFVLLPYNENDGKKDWGLMRRDFTVKAGFPAFATLVDQLGNAEPEGEVALGNGLKGYLYRQKDNSRTLVYWSCSEIDAGIQRPDLTAAEEYERKFRLPRSGKYSGVDLFGTPFEIDGREVTAVRYPHFLHNVKGFSVSVPFRKPATARPADRADLDKTILFRTELSDDFTVFSAKDGADVRKENARYKLQVWNLSDREKSGEIRITGGKIDGLPGTVTVPAFGKAEFDLTFTPEFGPDFKTELRTTGVFEGKKVSPHVIPLQSVKEIAAASRKVELPLIHDPVNWRKNASGRMEITYDAAEQALCFRTVFPPEEEGLWVYPEYVLQLPQESLAGAVGIGFEMKVSKAGAVAQTIVMAVRDNEPDAYLRIPAPTEQWEERFAQFPADVDPGKVKLLRFGMNPRIRDITYWIRNIRVYYAR